LFLHVLLWWPIVSRVDQIYWCFFML
jgi:hypothetical protein